MSLDKEEADGVGDTVDSRKPVGKTFEKRDFQGWRGGDLFGIERFDNERVFLKQFAVARVYCWCCRARGKSLIWVANEEAPST